MKKIINHVNVLDLSDYLTIEYEQCYEEHNRNHNKRSDSKRDDMYYGRCTKIIYSYPPKGKSIKRQGEYFKSKHQLDEYDGGIFIEARGITYSHRIYETLIDSSGHNHSVQIGTEDIKFKFTDDCFEIRNDDIRTIYDRVPIEVQYLSFQFNLKRYLLIRYDNYQSSYQYISGLLSELHNQVPDYFHYLHYRITDAMETAEFAPFHEVCFMSGNRQTTVDNYIPDLIFFNYKDKNKALNRIKSRRNIANNYLVKRDYKSINNDHELLQLLNNRFSNQVKFEQFIENHKYLINEY
jgi:hypothetical protein